MTEELQRKLDNFNCMIMKIGRIKTCGVQVKYYLKEIHYLKFTHYKMEAELSQWSKFSCQETEKEKQIQEMEEF